MDEAAAESNLREAVQAADFSAETKTRLLDAIDQAAPAASDRFQELLNQLLSGQWGDLNPDDWRLLAVQGGMRVALVLVILFLALTFAGWASGAVRASLTRMKFDPTLTKFLAKMARWGVLLLAGLSCLGYFGVETTSFAAVLGAAGFAVGLAFQGTLSNFAAGAMLLLFRPFKVGDVVNLGGQLGKVDEIELFSTALDTFDNRRIILPNSDVFGTTIENITHHPLRRVDVEVGADYAADIDTTRDALERAITTIDGVLRDPEPGVVLLGLGASSVDWKVQAWAPTADYLTIKQALIRAIKQSLDQEGIGIPFPQMDIHIASPPEGEPQQRAA